MDLIKVFIGCALGYLTVQIGMGVFNRIIFPKREPVVELLTTKTALLKAQKELNILYLLAAKDGNPHNLTRFTIEQIGGVVNYYIPTALVELELAKKVESPKN